MLENIHKKSYALDVFAPNLLRKRILEMAFAGQAVHVPCAFSLVEVVSLLYGKHLRFNPKDPHDPLRDFLVLSKGHGVMTLYAALHELGWITDEDLKHYFQDGSRLKGLGESDIPGIEVTAGSLGHGFPVATGIALGLKRKNKSNQVYCIAGDGEMNEGPMWESCLFAAHHKLDNLCLIIDANRFQAMGTTESIMGLEPLVEKFKSFGFESCEVDGHDVMKMDTEMNRLKKVSGKPKAIVARTIKGKGVSFMEGDNRWHYTRLTQDLLDKSLRELEDRA